MEASKTSKTEKTYIIRVGRNYLKNFSERMRHETLEFTLTNQKNQAHTFYIESNTDYVDREEEEIRKKGLIALADKVGGKIIRVTKKVATTIESAELEVVTIGNQIRLAPVEEAVDSFDKNKE